MNIENDLHDALLSASREAQDKFGYFPSRFLEMLSENGPVKTSMILIQEKGFSSGFTRLWENNRLDLSVEAIVLSGQWIELFSDELIKEAEVKLKKLNFIAPRYKLERKKESEWNDEELSSAIGAYFQMLNLERQNSFYNKSEFRNKLQAEFLTKRSKKSIEFRMQNISSVLEDMNLKWIEGFKPAKHVGKNVKNRIMSIIYSNGHIDRQIFEPSATQEELDNKVIIICKIGLSKKPKGTCKPQKAKSEVTNYYTDPKVKAWVMQVANGLCEYCDNPAPFSTPKGLPYLELHHINNLADGGSDTVENASALCPNCHRAFHYSDKRSELTENLFNKLDRIVK